MPCPIVRLAALIAFGWLISLPASAQMRITEFAYSATNGEFVEFTNVGASAVDMTDWTFRKDESAATSLSDFGVVEPGESVILTDAAAQVFRDAWGLCEDVAVIGANANKLGRNDFIRLSDSGGATVDELDYGDEDFPGSIRTQNISGRVPPAALGIDDITQWVLSSVGDAEDSGVSVGGDVGSPGRSPTHATVAFDACPQLGGIMRITEYMYSGGDGEYIEFSNVGDAPVDLAGWSFADSATAAGQVALDALGTVAPGESVILTEAAAEDFRTAWQLCGDARILGGNTTNLGRGDSIKLFDADDALVDTLVYSDQDFPGTIRTQNVSGWTTAANLGANTIATWQLSSEGDAERSLQSAAGDIGSPAHTTQSAVVYDSCPPEPPAMRITEFMYKGSDDEFVEFTNVGTTPIDMSGWSYDDDSAVPGTLDLGVFGIVQAGESVLLAESPATTFRAAWNLCEGVKVLGANATGNLGNGDTIHLFDSTGALVDRLAYPGDGPPFTDGVSAWVPAEAVGQDMAAAWVLSSLDDIEGSVASSGGDVGNPGRSERRALDFDPCVGLEGAPTVMVDAASTSRFLSLPTNGAGAVSGVVDDPTDPAAIHGIGFAIADPDGPADALITSASSSNAAVVAPEGLQLGDEFEGLRLLRIVPLAAGRSTITLRAEDADGKVGSYVIDYAASAAAVDAANTRFHTGASDASTAVAVDDNWMFVADDENQVLRLYDRTQSGLHLAGFDFTASLGLTDIDDGVPREVDIEASTRDGDRIFWIGAHGNQATGSHNARPNRRRIYATDLVDAGDVSSLSYVSRYDFLLDDLVAWDQMDGHGLGANALGFAASTAPNVSPEVASGFNIEGLALAPDGTTGYVAFRAPLQPLASRSQGLIVPVLDFAALVTGAAPDEQPAGSAQFGAPILLDLGGRAIRSIDRNSAGLYLIVAGPVGSAGAAPDDFRIYRWSGDSADAPALLPNDLTALAGDGSIEGIVSVPEFTGPQTAVQLIYDNGGAVYYGDGVEAKDLGERLHAKFRSATVLVDLPLVVEIFADGFE